MNECYLKEFSCVCDAKPVCEVVFTLQSLKLSLLTSHCKSIIVKQVQLPVTLVNTVSNCLHLAA